MAERRLKNEKALWPDNIPPEALRSNKSSTLSVISHLQLDEKNKCYHLLENLSSFRPFGYYKLYKHLIKKGTGKLRCAFGAPIWF